MWPNAKETADLVTLLKKFLMENFIFCAVFELWWECEYSTINRTSKYENYALYQILPIIPREIRVVNEFLKNTD